MSEQILLKSFTAGGNINARRFVELNSAGDKITQANYDTDNIIGVADTLSYKTGDRVDVGLIGVFDVEAGVAISAGAFVSSDSKGRAETSSSGKTIAGQALEKASAAGDIIKCILTHGKY